MTKIILLADKWNDNITPNTDVGGLPIIIRSLLTLEWSNVEHVIVVCGKYRNLIEKIAKKREFSMKVEFEDEFRDKEILSVRADVLFNREILKENLKKGELNGKEVLFTLKSKNDVKKAVSYLWKQLRKPIENDGVVAYYLGRPVSRIFSHFMIHLPLTPNHVTLLSFISALIGAFFVSFQNTIILGASLYWFSFVFDCIDGEIARLKFLGSKFGQWLDTIVDDLATTLFTIGLSLVLYKISSEHFYLYAGIGGSLLYIISSVFVYRVLHKIGVIDTAQYPFFFLGEGGSASTEKGFFTYFAYLFRRDVILFLHLIFAISGLYKAMFWMQFGLNSGMSFITFTDQVYRLVTNRWPWKNK